MCIYYLAPVAKFLFQTTILSINISANYIQKKFLLVPKFFVDMKRLTSDKKLLKGLMGCDLDISNHISLNTGRKRLIRASKHTDKSNGPVFGLYQAPGTNGCRARLGFSNFCFRFLLLLTWGYGFENMLDDDDEKGIVEET